ncbi:hypothetical protein SAMN02745163_01999 [Clostridium cavendishii DSM 21758]|uniref:Uncharacterized protein n=1 Tax=Clostridium cavendishii DSM 21758 TaxID=1121302 RepID=A0A1M6JDS4_9CLOT|nr:hypothetical protein [Clostridium cavendishii]SHJ44833.1 hypothetical protein SAMN02745163_01999 [Clostridium cavendishii DSM 21758]
MSESTIIILFICITVIVLYGLTIVFVFSSNAKLGIKGKKADSEVCITLDKEKDN